MNVTLLYQNDGSLVIHSSYRAAFIRDVKAHIPPSCRKWRSRNQSWVISARCSDIGIKLFKKHFPNGDVFPPRQVGAR